MIEKIQELIQDQAQKHTDERLKVFKIKIGSLEADQLALTGRVLEQADLEELLKLLAKQSRDLRVDVSDVNVLRKPSNSIQTVNTNLISVHDSASFLSEQLSQLVYGEKVEILAEQANWAYVRQMDGYLGWAYKPYLTAAQTPDATHIVMDPVALLYAQPDAAAPIVTRIFCGSAVRCLSIANGWAQVSAHQLGWMKLTDLRALTDFPKTGQQIRAQMAMDVQRMIGVPYLWGGTASNGIDCSGLVRLLHRWVGIAVPRDADMQAAQCKRVEAPYRPGDLFFFGEGDSDRRITHVGFSLGGWEMIHSSRARNGVYQDDVQKKEGLRSIFAHAGTFIKD
jgi:SH3-like domain-containing protein